MELPQEIELWYVIPLIRKLLVLEFKAQNIKQKDIAALLNLTEPAVSQYLKEKRAKSCNIKIPADVQAAIKESAQKIKKAKGNGVESNAADNEKLIIYEINSLSNLFKQKRLICKIHMHKDQNLKDCNVCYE